MEEELVDDNTCVEEVDTAVEVTLLAVVALDDVPLLDNEADEAELVDPEDEVLWPMISGEDVGVSVAVSVVEGDVSMRDGDGDGLTGLGSNWGVRFLSSRLWLLFKCRCELASASEAKTSNAR